MSLSAAQNIAFGSSIFASSPNNIMFGGNIYVRNDFTVITHHLEIVLKIFLAMIIHMSKYLVKIKLFF